MRTPKSLRQLATAHKQASRMNEIDRAVSHAISNGPQFEHRDTESLVERAWQNDTTELHIGFRA